MEDRAFQWSPAITSSLYTTGFEGFFLWILLAYQKKDNNMWMDEQMEYLLLKNIQNIPADTFFHEKKTPNISHIA